MVEAMTLICDGRMHMKKKWLVIVGILIILIGMNGCKKNVISDDQIAVLDYKHLEIADNANEEEIWQMLIDNCELKDYSQEEVELLAAELEKQYSYTAIPQGKTSLELIEDLHGMTPKELAIWQLKKQYVIRLIAKEEGLELTSKEYQKELEVQAQKNGFATAEEYEEIFSKKELKQRFLEERVLHFLVGNQ